MRNLLLLLRRNYSFLLFLALEAICFFIIVQNSNFHQVKTLNASNFIAGNLYAVSNEVSTYINLREENAKLSLENSRLRAYLKQSKYYDKTEVRIVNSKYRQLYTYIPANVINNSANRLNNYITINKGSKHDIKENFGIISPEGIVGIVKQSSPKFATGMSILHKDIRISAVLKRSNTLGSIVWEGRDPSIVTLKDIPGHVDIEKGDSVITSGYSMFFPKGINIGVVESHDLQEGTNFYIVKVRLAVNMMELENVYVVNHLMREEIKLVEEDNVRN